MRKLILLVAVASVSVLAFMAPAANAYQADRHGSCSSLGAYRYHEGHFDRCYFDGTGFYNMGWYPVNY